jgi:branched-chain amino acid transport system ATP-binding protein
MMLSLTNISAYYKDPHFPTVEGISIQLGQGEIVALLGPNGAGKSTILKSIFGLAHVAVGKVQFKDEDITGLPSVDIAQRGIGYVFQGRRLFPSLSVLENLEMGAYVRTDTKEIKRDLEKVFEMFAELRPLAGKAACYLSGGEQQMVAFGRALMLRPKVLLLDEPSIGLSPIVAENIFSSIQKISDDGVSILLVEQNVEFALKSSARAYILRNGRVALEDTSRNLSTRKDLKDIYLGA